MILPKLKIAGILGAFLLVVIVLTYWRGDSNGYNRAIEDMAAVGIRQSTEARIDQEKTANEEKTMDDAAIDRGLYDLGIMRAPDNR